MFDRGSPDNQDAYQLGPSHHLEAQWASYQIRKIAGCACAGNAGNVFPSHRLHRKPLVSDLDMHHGTCVTHVPWCMSGSLTRGGGENVPGIPGACTNLNFTYLARRPWQSAEWAFPLTAANYNNTRDEVLGTEARFVIVVNEGLFCNRQSSLNKSVLFQNQWEYECTYKRVAGRKTRADSLVLLSPINLITGWKRYI